MSLRADKKRTMTLRVQDEAFRLALAHGYEGTTIEAVAAAAKVSPSTVYRTFGTKEGIFLWDELEIPAIEALEAELAHHSPVEAVIAVVEAIGTADFHIPAPEMRERARFIFGEPALRSALGEAFARFEGTLAEMFSRKGDTGRQHAQIVAAAGVAAVRGATEQWACSEAGGDLADAVHAAAISLGDVLNG